MWKIPLSLPEDFDISVAIIDLVGAELMWKIPLSLLEDFDPGYACR
jgi:hypothetical protein